VPDEKVRVARRFVEAIHAEDEETTAICCHPDIEWHNTSAFPGRRTLMGPKAIVAFWRDLLDSFDLPEGSTEIETITVIGDRVVMELRSSARGKSSAVPLDVRWALILLVRDGRIARAHVRGTYADAVEAAGRRD
jgi:ketosteroid isomerase-like protein